MWLYKKNASYVLVDTTRLTQIVNVNKESKINNTIKITEIIEFNNSTKGWVDSIEKMLSAYGGNRRNQWTYCNRCSS